MISGAEEILDIVDENDQVIGKKSRSDIYSEGLKNYRVVNAFVVNSEGKLWIPRRTASKKLFPLALDMSVGGHVSSGENYDFAFKRELEEELHMNSENIFYVLLGHLSPYKHGVSAFMNVYEIKYNDIPNYEKNDFFEYFWLSPKEILDKLSAGDIAKSDLSKIVKIFYLKGAKNNGHPS